MREGLEVYSPVRSDGKFDDTAPEWVRGKSVWEANPVIVQRLKDQTRALARTLKLRGLMNVQYAIKDNEIYVIEVNPRASRTVPFVSKATGIPWAKIAAKVMGGKTLALSFVSKPSGAVV